MRSALPLEVALINDVDRKRYGLMSKDIVAITFIFSSDKHIFYWNFTKIIKFNKASRRN